MAQVYWATNTNTDKARRLRHEAAALLEEALYHRWKIPYDGFNLDSENPDSAAEDDADDEEEFRAQYRAVMAQIRSLESPPELVPGETIDETHTVSHSGDYSIYTGRNSQTVSFVNVNPDVETRQMHTEVNYRFIDVLLPKGFAHDGTPLYKTVRSIVREENSVPDN